MLCTCMVVCVVASVRVRLEHVCSAHGTALDSRRLHTHTAVKPYGYADARLRSLGLFGVLFGCVSFLLDLEHVCIAHGTALDSRLLC
jgi:lipoate-protein ligase B